MDDVAVQHSPSSNRPTIDFVGLKAPHVLLIARLKAVEGRKLEAVAPDARNSCLVRATQPSRRFGQSVEHGLQIEGRAADHLEHVSGGGLLLQRFPQLAEQPGVLDGDHRLRSEVLHQCDLRVGERSYLLPIDHDGADQLTVLEHRHRQEGSRACAFDQRDDPEIAAQIALVLRHVRNVDHLFGAGETSGRQQGIVADDERRIATPVFLVVRIAVNGHRAKVSIFEQKEIAKLGFADARGTFQDRLENRVQITG